MCQTFLWYFRWTDDLSFAEGLGRFCGDAQPQTEIHMPDPFSPFTLKGVTLRNRIAMSPMTMYYSFYGDFHVVLMGSRAAGGFGLVFTEQIAITPDGHTSVGCAGIWSDAKRSPAHGPWSSAPGRQRNLPGDADWSGSADG